MEPTIIRWMHRVISTQKKFKVTLDKYSGFPPHTIYLRVQDHEPFKQLAKELKVVDQYVRSYGCPAARLHTYPHLSLARRLPENIYRKLKLCMRKNFHASFEVNQLLLLRREHQFDSCKQVNVFGCNPSPNPSLPGRGRGGLKIKIPPMETDILSSYATAEYLLVIEPHEALRNEISQVKKYFAETYDCPAAALVNQYHIGAFSAI
jgi:hypothetical protein